MTKATESSVEYTLSLTVKVPVRLYDDDATVASVAEWMMSAQAKRELEREVLQYLRKLDGDCDIEVMDTKLSDPQAVR